jgi:hypothetical protein
LIFLDAHDTLARFMRNGMPDRLLFTNTVATILNLLKHNTSLRSSLPSSSICIRAYGEMVDILWGEGNAAAAIELEKLWNEVRCHHQFVLLCAYSINTFTSSDTEHFKAMCHQHCNTSTSTSTSTSTLSDTSLISSTSQSHGGQLIATSGASDMNTSGPGSATASISTSISAATPKGWVFPATNNIVAQAHAHFTAAVSVRLNDITWWPAILIIGALIWSSIYATVSVYTCTCIII